MDPNSQPNNPTNNLINTPLNAGESGKSTNDQIRKLGEKVERANLPQELRDLLTERVSRLALMRASAGFMSANYILEYENAASYINWVIGLPWNLSSQDVMDLITC